MPGVLGLEAALRPDLTAVSLFAGIGNFDRALERSGIRVVAAVEIDADCRGVLACHFPETRLFGDVREVTGDDLRAAGFVPGRGLMCGGSPCQDFSVAGRREGLAGARSGLFWEFVRLAGELLPQWIIFENVPGLLSSVCSCPGDETCIDNGRAVRCGRWEKRAGKRVWLPHAVHIPAGGACPGGCMGLHGGAMGTVLGALGKLGYGVAYRVLDSQFFDVPQRRERVFIVGCLGDWGAPAEVLLEPEGGEGDLAPGGKARARAAGAAPGSAGGSGTVGTLGTSGPGGGWRIGADEAAAGQLVTAATLQGGGRRGHRIDAEGAAGGHLILSQNGSDIQVGESSLEIGEPGDPAFTLRTPGGGSSYPMAASTLTALPGVATGLAVRRLTPLECERLQACPDDWTRWKITGGHLVEQSDSARYRQIGNAVTESVIEWIAARIVLAEASGVRLPAAEGAA